MLFQEKDKSKGNELAIKMIDVHNFIELDHISLNEKFKKLKVVSSTISLLSNKWTRFKKEIQK